jgi:hypothetical protein
MLFARPAFAPDPRSFGRAYARAVEQGSMWSSVWADLKLFTMTFVGGFIFVSIFIG